MTTPKNLLIISSGGDAPGMNAAIRAVVRSAAQRGINTLGVQGGYEGLIDNEFITLIPSSVANCLQHGGTILRTTRSQRFLDEHVRHEVRQKLKDAQVDAAIVLGGNGSLAGAAALQHEELSVIGIPCTIDNDIVGTDNCIGFDTACNTALHAIDKIRDTALSLQRGFIIEVMGRASGFLAATVGMAAGAEIIITPEFPLSTQEVIAQLHNKKREKLTSIIVAAESDQPGWTINLAKEINEQTSEEFRTCILGHIQRGGSPSAYDRVLATRMGHEAVEALYAGKKQGMISVIDNDISLQNFPPNNIARTMEKSILLDINAVVSQT